MCVIIIMKKLHRGVAQMVARMVRDHEAASSSLATPTTRSKLYGLLRIFISQRQRGRDHTIAASFHMRLSGSSEQTGDPAVFVHVDLLGGGDLRQPRHGHDLARQGNDEARTGADRQAAHGDGKILGRAQQSRVVRQRVLSLCHATGRSPKPSSVSRSACFWAAGVSTACAPP